MGRYLKRLIQIIVITFITLYCVIWAFSPLIVRHAINNYGLPAPLFLTSDSSIRYNPFTAHLTINDLAVKLNETSTTLKVKSLNAELDLHQMLFDKIYVAEFNVSGIFIPIIVNESSLNIAGIELRDDKKVEVEAVSEENVTQSSFPYQVVIPELTLTDATVEVMHFSQKHTIELATFSLQNILLSQNEQVIKLNLISQLNGAPIEVALDGSLLKKQGEISVELNAKNIDLSNAKEFLPPSIISLDGKVSYTSKLKLVIKETETVIDINELMLEVNDLVGSQDNLAVSVKHQKIQLQPFSKREASSTTSQTSDVSNHDVKMNVVINNNLTSVDISNLMLNIDQLHVEQNNTALDIKRHQMQANNINILLPVNAPVSVDAKLNVNLDSVSAISTENKAILAEIANVLVNNVDLKLQQNIAKVNVENVLVSHSQFSKNVELNMPALAAFKAFSVNNIAYSPELIAIDNVTLSGFVANALLNKDKQLSTLVTLTPNKGSQSKDLETAIKPIDNTPATTEVLVAKEGEGEGVKQIFRLGKFTLIDDAQVDFKDSSVTPHYERNVNITHLVLSNIDTGKPGQEVTLEMQGKTDKYASLDIKGRGLPFAEQQKFSLNAEVKELSLPGISSYIKKALKYEIESGQLDLTIDAGLTGNKINGDVDLLLRGVEFTAADDNERGLIKDQFSVPFNVALGMLKDSDGNVELSLPLKGDTSSPSFGLSGLLTLLVKQATMSAAKDYLITTFVPYASVMKVAMAAGEFALKLRINDLVYPATAIELNPEQLEFSRQMSVMLADRGNINVKLCPVATASDIELEDASQAHQPDNIARLRLISQQRVELFKAHLVEQLKVPSARLLFCTPQIDTSKGAKPRIKFVI